MDRSVVSLLSKPVGVRAVSQRLIPTGEQSELQTRIAPTEDPPLCAEQKSRFGMDEPEPGHNRGDHPSADDTQLPSVRL